VGLVGGFVLHYAARHWRFIAEQLLAALKQRRSRPSPDRPKVPDTGFPANRTLH